MWNIFTTLSHTPLVVDMNSRTATTSRNYDVTRKQRSTKASEWKKQLMVIWKRRTRGICRFEAPSPQDTLHVLTIPQVGNINSLLRHTHTISTFFSACIFPREKPTKTSVHWCISRRSNTREFFALFLLSPRTIESSPKWKWKNGEKRTFVKCLITGKIGGNVYEKLENVVKFRSSCSRKMPRSLMWSIGGKDQQVSLVWWEDKLGRTARLTHNFWFQWP